VPQIVAKRRSSKNNTLSNHKLLQQSRPKTKVSKKPHHVSTRRVDWQVLESRQHCDYARRAGTSFAGADKPRTTFTAITRPEGPTYVSVASALQACIAASNLTGAYQPRQRIRRPFGPESNQLSNNVMAKILHAIACLAKL
jgi:hypothetical protein